MSVQFKNALVSDSETFIAAQVDGHALFETVVLGSGRGKVTAGEKVLRFQIREGAMTMASEPQIKQERVLFVAQFYKKPSAQTVEAIDVATDESFEMAEGFHDYFEGSNLGGACCSVTFPEVEEGNYEMGTANLFNTVYGATYLYGVINP